MKITIFLLCFFLILSIAVLPTPELAFCKDKSQIVKVPKYTVLSKQTEDVLIKTQVRIDILLRGKYTKGEIGKLLKKIYGKYAKSTGYRYRRHPTNIYVYAFISKEHYKSGSGQWIAMLDKNRDDEFPNIRFNKLQIEQLDSMPKQKFAVSERKRKKIFKEMVKAEDKAYEESKIKYSCSSNLTVKDDKFWAIMDTQKKVQDEIYEKELEKLSEKYNATREQLDEIALEGMKKDWPLPPE